MKQFHEAVDIDGIQIDAQIAGVMRALWAAGARTKFCCQGGPTPSGGTFGQGDGYIMFADDMDAVPDFFAFVTRTTPKSCQGMQLDRAELGGNSCWIIRFDPEWRAAIRLAAEALPPGWFSNERGHDERLDTATVADLPVAA